MYGLVVCITYPIALFPLKLSIIAYTKVDRESDPKRWYGLFAAFTLVFLIPGVGITLVYENIAAIFGLVGSLCGGVIYFGVPIWVYYKLPFLRIEYPQDINKEFSDAAGNTGIIRTEAIGTSVLALLLPGSANEAISRARVLSVTDTTSVSSVKVRSKSMENPVLSIRSLIGFARESRSLLRVLVFRCHEHCQCHRCLRYLDHHRSWSLLRIFDHGRYLSLMLSPP